MRADVNVKHRSRDMLLLSLQHDEELMKRPFNNQPWICMGISSEHVSAFFTRGVLKHFLYEFQAHYQAEDNAR